MVRICQKQNFKIFRHRLDTPPGKKRVPLYKKFFFGVLTCAIARYDRIEERNKIKLTTLCLKSIFLCENVTFLLIYVQFDDYDIIKLSLLFSGESNLPL